MSATSGACPICAEHFDDLSVYAAHLAREHDLVDEEGAESSFGVASVPRSEESPSQLAVIALSSDLLEEAPQRPRTDPPERGRPALLTVLVVALAVGLGALIAFAPDREGRDDDVASRTDVTTAPTVAGTQSVRAPSTTSTELTGATAASNGPTGAGVTTPPSGTASPAAVGRSGGAMSPTTTAPPTTPTAPTTTTTSAPDPVGYVAPTTSGGQVDGCEQVKNRLLITYSWSFDGGTGWQAPADYTAAGGGRYSHVVDVPLQGTTTISSVHVVDGESTTHDVPLSPELSSSAC